MADGDLRSVMPVFDGKRSVNDAGCGNDGGQPESCLFAAKPMQIVSDFRIVPSKRFTCRSDLTELQLLHGMDPVCHNNG
jgi:hypothetical protein